MRLTSKSAPVQSCKKTKNDPKPDLWGSKMSPIIPYVRHKSNYQYNEFYQNFHWYKGIIWQLPIL